MKNKKNKFIYPFIISILLITLVAYYKAFNVPTTIFLREGKSLKSNNIVKLVKDDSVNTSKGVTGTDQNADVSLLGIFKVKSVAIKSIPNELSVYPGGQPIGVKLNTKGVLIVALSDLDTDNGKVTSPASEAGLEIGDSIVEINNKKVINSEKAASLINECEGKEIEVTIERKGTTLKKKVKPVKSKDNQYKIGLWIRDSTAGVGTLTFYDNKTGTFAALGHPITDVDTGTILNVNSGQIVNSSIVSVRKGVRGTPGELKGIFIDEDVVLGQIIKNTQCGIFGKSNLPIKNKNNKKMKLALRDEIKEGPAQIYTTIDGSEPKLYNIMVEKLLPQNSPGPKSMVIKVTDKELLEKTGGIVQGMSGSPIIQDNKIIGAVTHVLINKPDTGYGIYIEWMLKDADILK
ncbi:stage IV sporulation protein B [Clostridium tetanomorphum]|uniref:SpoIVB peptidase n=1 Tax=Clostridium tetanomorphum TaxID=1553 RepID=A0A923E7A5_CLOTT|nr:SpoIVB peptidase [Clostridium tetanomorphum]KAJ51468.1 stage IV sporulation protein B [Clostridium tetanomorphum DSM 665]MBC2396562.1 SpoIVB peptidase [Clostridium tetanomorphum]MBP1863889.1 stage IV sporulation protein B [Clostridium tetanomorphum]NRS84967.1 stage IV sporulation protein B [Clostridium tetanomorphum]NRZ98183.1 stage IV sporulation protein B [Clostridium tetanomorphum]